MADGNDGATEALDSLGFQVRSPPRLLPGGSTTSVWAAVCLQGTVVLRLYPQNDFAGRDRELAAMKEAADFGVPVPAVRAVGQWHERPATVIDFVKGADLWTSTRKRPLRAFRLARSFGKTQARMHRGSRREGDAALLHLDYHPSNVLCDERQITSVIDWYNASHGDRRRDVARTYTILRVEPYVSGLEPISITLLRLVVAWGWLSGYGSVAGRLTNMRPFLASACVFMARDLEHRVADPSHWMRVHHLERIGRRGTRLGHTLPLGFLAAVLRRVRA